MPISCYNCLPMRKMSICLFVLLLAVLPRTLQAAGWEWQFSLGPWTLEPWTSPVASKAEKMVNDEATRLLTPLLSEFTIFSFEPQIDLHSRGWFATAACWRRLAADRFALGVSVSILNFSLPFTLAAEQDLYFLDIPIAHIRTRGQGQVDLQTIMLAAQGRWRAFHSGRIGIYTGLGLTLLSFSGRLRLPLTASVQSILGTEEWSASEDKTLAELRVENSSIPSWIMAPALSVSLHYRVGTKSRLFMEINLSQGTFLAAGLVLGR